MATKGYKQRNRILGRTVLTMLLRTGVLVLLLAGTAVAQMQVPVITVDDSGDAMYTSIQAAIDAAIPGDEINVFNGTYYENVNVNKQLILRGIDTGTGMPVVDGGGSGNVITISADGITLEGFIVLNMSAEQTGAGIMVHSSFNFISGNEVWYNGIGIWVEDNDYNTIVNNIVSYNYVGIHTALTSSHLTCTGNEIYLIIL